MFSVWSSLLLSGSIMSFFLQTPSAYSIHPFLSTHDRGLECASERPLHPDKHTHRGSPRSKSNPLCGFAIFHSALIRNVCRERLCTSLSYIISSYLYVFVYVTEGKGLRILSTKNPVLKDHLFCTLYLIYSVYFYVSLIIKYIIQI